MRFAFAAATTTLLLGCGDRVQVDEDRLGRLSLYGCPAVSGTYEQAEISDLIADPARLDRKAVKVSGYYYSSFEHSAIYPSPQDRHEANFQTGLWAPSVGQEFSGQRLTLRGAYHADGHGHLGQWPGTICVHSVVAADEP